MFNVGGGELLVIMLIALIVLGPQRLPDAARQVGRVMGDLRRISSGFQQELKDAFDDTDAVTPARRKESMPLASTVAAADRRSAARQTARDRATTARDARAGAGTSGTAGAPAGADPSGTGAAGASPAPDESTVAPAVAAALDEIVTPLDPPPSDRSGATAEAPPHPAEDDALGDERAAS